MEDVKRSTRKQSIINMLSSNIGIIGMSCAEITKYITNLEGITDKTKIRYLSGSISSVLNKMVKNEELEYADNKTKKGGRIYQIARSTITIADILGDLGK